MSCPLSYAAIGTVVEGLGTTFDTLDFIAACPNSGGTKTGEACPAVRK